MQKPIIILFNGPPGSGKDSLSEDINRFIKNGTIEKFAKPLKTVAKELYCHGDQALFDLMDAQGTKDKPDDIFLGETCRNVQIAISETYAKPLHGERVFGKLLASRIKAAVANNNNAYQPVFLISDSGFRQEAEELVEQFGAESILLFRIHREGKTYKGDSRSYINLDDLNVRSYDIRNVEGELPKVSVYTLTVMCQNHPEIHTIFSTIPVVSTRVISEIENV